METEVEKKRGQATWEQDLLGVHQSISYSLTHKPPLQLGWDHMTHLLVSRPGHKSLPETVSFSSPSTVTLEAIRGDDTATRWEQPGYLH